MLSKKKVYGCLMVVVFLCAVSQIIYECYALHLADLAMQSVDPVYTNIGPLQWEVYGLSVSFIATIVETAVIEAILFHLMSSTTKNELVCQHCGKKLKKMSAFCPYCGQALQNTTTKPAQTGATQAQNVPSPQAEQMVKSDTKKEG